MPKFNLNTKIDISFTEEQIKKILTDVVVAEMPNIKVNDINFITKRNPTNISADVDASLDGFCMEPNVKAETEKAIEVPPAEEEVEEENSKSVSDYLNLD